MSEKEEKKFGNERRKYLRLRASIVEYVPIGKTSTKELTFTENIGGGGIRILASEALEVDTLLSLKIYLSSAQAPIEVKGRIVWVEPSSFLDKQGQKHYDVGIEFVEIDNKNRQAILKYTNRHS